MDHNGNVFTTITGIIFNSFYYLKNPRKYVPYYIIHNNTDNPVVLKNNNILRGDIRTIFLLKKKYKLPKFITYIILIEISKLHLKYFLNGGLFCGRCNINIGNKICHICDKCSDCNTLNKKLFNCIMCADSICINCMAEGKCDYCYESVYKR